MRKTMPGGWAAHAPPKIRRAAVDFAKHALQINPGNAEARRLSVDKPDSTESKIKSPRSRWSSLVRYVVPAAITFAVLILLLFKSTAW